MGITLKFNPGDRVIELGGGANPSIHPNVDVRQCKDKDGKPTVDLIADFNLPLPIGSDEWDAVFSQFVIEHLSWRSVRLFIAEVFRIIKPGGKAVIVTANTETQLRYIQIHPSGWDGRPLFESASCILFGDQDYPENTHKNYMSPSVVTQLFQEAGFSQVLTQPYGALGTDMVVSAVKAPKLDIEIGKAVENAQGKEANNEVIDLVGESDKGTCVEVPGGAVLAAVPPGSPSSKKDIEDFAHMKQEQQEFSEFLEKTSEEVKTWPEWKQRVLGTPVQEKESKGESEKGMGGTIPGNVTGPSVSPDSPPLYENPAQVFNRLYFENYRGPGQFYWDHPSNEVAFRKVMDRRPTSVLEIGCGRGYVLKRLQDVGVTINGIEVSKHCQMTRACEGGWLCDATKVPWPTYPVYKDQTYDLCLSIGLLEHIPENLIPKVLAEATRTSRRQLHAITFEGAEPWPDKTRITLKPAEWWFELFKKTGTKAEIVPLHEFLSGSLPSEYVKGDGKVKLNIGCFMTMFHNGWVNMDIHDLRGFAQGFGYDYRIHDATLGLPYGTGTVDLIYSSHMLEHLSYAEGVSFLRECRRVIRSDGAMRIIVPDAHLLMEAYRNTAAGGGLYEFDEINEGCANAPTAAGKLWSLLHEGHKACYDNETLQNSLAEAGWTPYQAAFRHTMSVPATKQILRETLDMLPSLSLYVDAIPKTGK